MNLYGRGHSWIPLNAFHLERKGVWGYSTFNLGFDVSSYFQGQWYITWGCNKTWCFLPLPLQRKEGMTVWRQCSAGKIQISQIHSIWTPQHKKYLYKGVPLKHQHLPSSGCTGRQLGRQYRKQRAQGALGGREGYIHLFCSASSIRETFFLLFFLLFQFHIILAPVKYFRIFHQWIFSFKPPGNQFN